MKTFFSQNRLLIWLVIFLLVLNISAISSIIYHRVRETKEIPSPFQPPIAWEGRMPDEGRFLRDYLELDKAQFEQFMIKRHGFQTKARGITEELREKKVEFLEELNKKDTDTSKIRELSEDIGQLHKALRLESGKYYLGLRTICNDEQRQKLHRFFMHSLGRHDMEPLPGRGRGMHQRMMKNNRIKPWKDSIN
ncbi:MAG: periplasmic heavy metal sensor [Bacteroidales bacterium]|nr:periplasmic heavy metal sensor [Bacteroidales bacterium]